MTWWFDRPIWQLKRTRIIRIRKNHSCSNCPKQLGRGSYALKPAGLTYTYLHIPKCAKKYMAKQIISLQEAISYLQKIEYNKPEHKKANKIAEQNRVIDAI